MGSSSRTAPRRRSYGDHVRPTPRLPEATALDLRGQVDSDYACARRYLGRHISRRSLDWVSDELARALIVHGVARGKRLAVAVHNVSVLVAVALATRRSGAVLVPFVSKLPTTDTGRFPCRHRRAQSPAVDAAL